MSEATPATVSEALLVSTTTETVEAATHLAQQLVERELAACVQIVSPIKSVYRWQGKVEMADEVLILIKTTAVAYAALETAIKELHSYQTPEIIAVPITLGSAEYLSWLQAGVKSAN